MSELLPCPFCGGAPNVMRSAALPWLYCNQCEAAGPMTSTHAAAIAAWNRRATPADGNALRARVEALEAELRVAIEALEEAGWVHTADKLRAALGDTP